MRMVSARTEYGDRRMVGPVCEECYVELMTWHSHLVTDAPGEASGKCMSCVNEWV